MDRATGRAPLRISRIDGGGEGEGKFFVVSFGAACCLLVQCILELAALSLLTVAAHPTCDGVSMTSVSRNRSSESLITCNRFSPGLAGDDSTLAAYRAATFFLFF